MSRRPYRPLPAYMPPRDGLFNPPHIQTVSKLARIARVEANQVDSLTVKIQRLRNLLHEQSRSRSERQLAFHPIKKEESLSLHLFHCQQSPIQTDTQSGSASLRLIPEPLPAQHLSQRLPIRYNPPLDPNSDDEPQSRASRLLPLPIPTQIQTPATSSRPTTLARILLITLTINPTPLSKVTISISLLSSLASAAAAAGLSTSCSLRLWRYNRTSVF
ncbi:hypothetical protein BDV95DRAFT_30416 [Massariosphaeria phaeospora]|uniref:Uncharacterized protein n=1 Tax=Massariosphaeria phaeospora TaxID=100035 RepID=A0A7C8I6I9_9PLEO|nr:hypothetical protein BDV95DRAFT_30416 [Massariosphaeria phaeospora]